MQSICTRLLITTIKSRQVRPCDNLDPIVISAIIRLNNRPSQPSITNFIAERLLARISSRSIHE